MKKGRGAPDIKYFHVESNLFVFYFSGELMTKSCKDFIVNHPWISQAATSINSAEVLWFLLPTCPTGVESKGFSWNRTNSSTTKKTKHLLQISSRWSGIYCIFADKYESSSHLPLGNTCFTEGLPIIKST